MVRRENITTTHLAPGVSPRDGEPRHDGDDSLPGVGAVIAGKYRIDGLLGRGGMGVVALGKQLELDRPVAIKFLRAPLAANARPLERFAREARIIARMRSEHVVRVFDVGREKDVPFIVMERLSGHDLAKEIDRGKLSVERGVEFVLHACEALGEAHSLGIVHRDVKPSNLFVAQGLGGRESLKVLDFGVSKWLLPQDPDASSISTDGAAIGTPAFASPEQLTRPETIDARTDVWALGVVLYEALSGELPFRADTIPALYTAIIAGNPAPFPNPGGVPAGLVVVIERCLRRNPDDRYSSMLELARALVPFAPTRAHGIVDSLATLAELAQSERSEVPEEPMEKAASVLSTTLGFSQITPPPADLASTTRATRRRNFLSALLALVVVVGAVVVFAWPGANERVAPPAVSVTTADAALDRPAPAPASALANEGSTTAAQPPPLAAPSSSISAAQPPRVPSAPSPRPLPAGAAAGRGTVNRPAVEATPHTPPSELAPAVAPASSVQLAPSAAPATSTPSWAADRGPRMSPAPPSNVVPIYRH